MFIEKLKKENDFVRFSNIYRDRYKLMSNINVYRFDFERRLKYLKKDIFIFSNVYVMIVFF